MGLVLRPGTDGALACAVMHVLFRDDLADRAYLEKYTDDPKGLEAHLATRTPEWASAITGLSVAEIEAFARLVGTTKNTFFRLGYGFARQRNGSANMHAALSVAAVTGCWQYEGGGAFHSNSGILKLDNERWSRGSRLRDPKIRHLDHSRIGPVLTGAADALYGGPPVTAHADPEHQPGQRRARAAAGEAGVSARRPVHLRARAVHDRHGEARRRRAAGDDVSGARRHLQGRRQPAHHARAEADRPAGRAAHQPFRHRGTGASGSASAHMPGFGLTEREHIDDHAGEEAVSAASTAFATSAGPICSRTSRRRISSTASAMPTEIPLPAGLDGQAAPNRPPKSMGLFGDLSRAAGVARPCRPDRGGRRRAPVPAGDLAGAQFPQLDLRRDAGVAPEGGPAGTADPSRRRGRPRPCRRRPRRGRQRPRRGRAARETVCRAEARRGDRRGHLAQQRPRARRGHQRLDRRRRARALWRRGLPRQQGLGAGGWSPAGVTA